MAKDKNEKGAKAKKRIFIESIVVFLVVISPFVFKLHEYFSSDPEATVSFFGFTFDRNGFQNISIYAWFLLGKLVPLYLLIIWFLTCKHWWYHIILIPIIMYTFQIFEGVFSEDNYIDTENVMWLLPVCMVVIPFVYFIRIKLYDKYVHGIDLEAMDAELKTLKKTNPVDDKTSAHDEDNHDTKDELDEPQMGYQSFSDYINSTFSTNNIERQFKRFQNNLKGWLHLKF